MGDNMLKRKFALECDSDCADEIIKAVRALDGVSSFNIDPDLTGTVEYDEKKIDGKRIYESISSLGADVNSDKIEMDVEGMGCEGCAETIQKGLNSMDGVSSAKVSFEEKKAEVIFNPIATSIDEMKLVVSGLGYKLL